MHPPELGVEKAAQQFSLWPLRSAPGSLGTYGFLTPPYGLPYGLELKNNPRLCTSLRVYGSNTPQEAAILIYAAARRQSENCRAPKAKMRIAGQNHKPQRSKTHHSSFLRCPRHGGYRQTRSEGY